MIEPPRLRRGDQQVIRQQLALELALNAFAAVGALLVARALLRVLEVSPTVWSGRTIYGVTDRMVWPLTILPGADRQLAGAATLADITAVALLLLVPLWLAARSRRQP